MCRKISVTKAYVNLIPTMKEFFMEVVSSVLEVVYLRAMPKHKHIEK